MTDGSPIKAFITGACAGLAEVRQALQAHPEIEIVGTAVEPGKADAEARLERRAGRAPRPARGDRLPAADVEAIRQATAAPIMLVTSGGAARGLLQEALGAGVADVVLLPQLTDALVFTIRQDHASWPPAAAAVGAGLAARVDRRGQDRDGLLAQGRRRQDRSRPAARDQLARQAGRRVLLRRPRPPVRRRRDHDGRRAREDDLRPRHDDGRPRPREARRLRHRRTPRASTSSPRRCAPRTPSSSPRTASARLLDVAKEAYDAIVVDTPGATSTRRRWPRSTAPTACSSSRALDIPAVKNIKLTLQTLNLLHYPKERIHLVHQPRACRKAELDRRRGREGARPEGGVRDSGRPRGRRGRQPRRAGAHVGAALRRRQGARATWPSPAPERARASSHREARSRSDRSAAAKRPASKLRKAA